MVTATSTMVRSLDPLGKSRQSRNNVEGGQTGTISGYEQSREERIRENMDRMQKLGILDIRSKLKPAERTLSRRSPKCSSETKVLFSPYLPARRSSRLKNMTPVSYKELPPSKKGEYKSKDICIHEGTKPEVYNEEHDKLLGDCKTCWTLLVDGYDNNGKRIYDPVNGRTCHQCRQKTLGHHTHCCKCSLVQGQFCGDCLYMRYGENVLEANENPEWICPVCRGICNCSLCRKERGWIPTGNLYRKVIKLGYKSVAHYLIQTMRSPPNPEDASTESNFSTKESVLSLCSESPDFEEDEETGQMQLEGKEDDAHDAHETVNEDKLLEEKREV